MLVVELPFGDIVGKEGWWDAGSAIVAISLRSELQGTLHSGLNVIEPAVDHAGNLLGRVGGAVAREVVLDVVSVVLAGGGHGVPVLEELMGHIERDVLWLGVSERVKLVQCGLDGDKHLVELGRDDDITVVLVDDFLDVLHEEVELVGFRHSRSDHAGKTVHAVEPSRASTFVLNSHSPRITHGELDRGEQEELGDWRAHVRRALAVALPAGVNSEQSRVLVTEGLLLLHLLPVEVGGIKLDHVLGLSVERQVQNVLFGARLDGGGGEEVSELLVVHQRFFSVWEDAQVRFDHVNVVVPVIGPVPGSVHCHGTILCGGQDRVQECLVVLGAVDVQVVAELEELSWTERPSADDFAQDASTVGIGGDLVGNFLGKFGIVEDVHDGFNGQRFVPVGLDEGQEHLDVKRSHAWQEGHIVTTILCDITVVARALRKVLRHDLECIVITLQISVDAGEGMEDLHG
mmetsp:Transcript_22935/g.64987  ORF Transcript_22935/g.64987 Transcript_22935/m.64987 type:complete len:460 (-) Transcript_22935:1780-3159(-)